MLDILVKLDILRELIEIAVDAHAHITALLGPLQHLLMASLPSSDHGSQKLKLRSLRQFHDLIHHLVHGLPRDDPAALRTVRRTDSCVKQTEIIVNLRHGTDGGSGVSVRRLLVDGDRGRQSVDALHIGFLHLSQEHSRIRGQRLHVSSLPFRVDRIECQR